MGSIQPRIFISHSSADLPFVRKLADDLQQALGDKRVVWYDAHLEGGEQWRRKIVEELRRSTIFLIVCSPAAMTSDRVNDEIDLAWRLKNSPVKMRIIPLLYQPCQLRYDLENLQIVRFLAHRPYQDALQELLQALSISPGITEASVSEAQPEPEAGKDHQPNLIQPPQPLELFYCYARVDRALRDKLDAHLATLRRTGLITAWYDGEIIPGTSWEEEIETHLDTADIILLLISPEFIQSDYCYSKEMKRALERHRMKEARVVPVLLRPVDWAGTPFSSLQMLPSDARPVTRWRDRDEALEDVAKGIRKVMNDLRSQRIRAPDASVPPAPTKLPQVPLPSINSQQRPSQHRISRRAAMIGLAGGLTGVIILGSFAWQIHSQGLQISPTAAPLTAVAPSIVAADATEYAKATATNGAMFGFNAQHTHSNPYEKILTPATVSHLKKKWTYQANYSLGNSSPAVVDGMVYIGSRNGKLYAIDAISGSQKWVYQTNGPITSSPAVADGVVYIGSWDSSLYAIDVVSGTRKWAYRTGSYVLSSPTVADGVVYIGSWDSSLYAIDVVSGTRKWVYQTGSNITSSPAVADGVVYIGSHDFNLYAINAVSGTKKWAYQTGHNIDYSSPAVVSSVVYIGSQDSNLYAISAASGAKQWAYQTGSYIDSSPAVAGGVVYIGSVKDHTLYAVDTALGTTRWIYQTGGDIESSPTVAGGVVYISSRDHTLYAIDAVSGTKLWDYQTGGGFDSSPAVADGVVYVGSSDQNLYAFTLPAQVDEGGSERI